MKKVAIVLLACFIVFSMVSCKEEQELKVLSMADASKIILVCNTLMNSDETTETDSCREYNVSDLPVTVEDTSAKFTGKYHEERKIGTGFLAVYSVTELTSGTDILLKDVEIKKTKTSGEFWDNCQIYKEGKEVTSDTEINEIKTVFDTFWPQVLNSVKNYTGCANDFCKYYLSKSGQLTTDTDCSGLGILSKGSTLTMVQSNDNVRRLAKRDATQETCDVEFEI